MGQSFTSVRIDFDRLMLLSRGMVCCPNDEDCIVLIEEEARLVDALSHSQGDVSLARRKLMALAARLRTDGHDDCEEGLRNLKLLESAIRDLVEPGSVLRRKG